MRLETDAELDALQAGFPDNDGHCGYCHKLVSVGDPDHRITPIGEGGRGVECRRRGDY